VQNRAGILATKATKLLKTRKNVTEKGESRPERSPIELLFSPDEAKGAAAGMEGGASGGQTPRAA
jgi:hypothetical protein